MTAAPTPTPSNTPLAPRPLWRRWLRRSVIVLVSLALILLLGRSIWVYRLTSQIESELRAAEQRGEPLTFEALDAATTKPAFDDDAAPQYAAAMALVDGDAYNNLPDADLDAVTATQPAATVPQSVANLLSRHAAMFALLDAGTPKPACASDLQPQGGFMVTMDHQSRARKVARIMELRTCTLVGAGQADRAVDSAIAELRFTRVFDRQPILISYLVKLACIDLALWDAQRVIRQTRPSRFALARLGEALEQVDRADELVRVVDAERIYDLGVYENLLAGVRHQPLGPHDHVPAPESVPAGWLTRPAMLRQCLSSLIDLRDARRYATMDWPQKLDAPTGAHYPFDRRLFQSAARTAASLRTLRVAVVIEDRVAGGAPIPGDANDLQAALGAGRSIDPFTGKPLLFRRDAQGYTIYSVGRDGNDNGGDVESKTGWPADIGVRIARP